MSKFSVRKCGEIRLRIYVGDLESYDYDQKAVPQIIGKSTQHGVRRLRKLHYFPPKLLFQHGRVTIDDLVSKFFDRHRKC